MAPYAVYVWLPLLSLVVALCLMKKKKEGKTVQLPPGPPKLPIIGNLHLMGSLAHQSLWRLSKTYGPLMFLQLGGVPTLVVSSAEAAREILKVHDLDCCSRPPFATAGKLSYNYQDIAFAPYGHYWREIRKICVLQLFSPRRVQLYHSIREEEVWSMIDSIARGISSTSAGTASPFDFKDRILSLTENVTFRVSFGKNYRCGEADRFHEMVHEAMVLLGLRSASDFFPSIGWLADWLTGLRGRLDRSFRALDAFYQKVIDDHLSPARTLDEKHETIVDVLLRVIKETEFDETSFTKEHVKAILMNIFLAGVDTSAITIEWAMAELARKPILMQNAQNEVRNCIGNKGRVSESDLDRLQFLKMVVKETFRLHPPAVPLVPRETMSFFKTNGYDIYPKTRIYVNAWAIGRDPNSWKDPEEFLPERFVDNPIDYKGQHFELLPFGAGRRVCPGLYIGTIMVELALANLLYHFNWKLPDEMKVEDINMEEEAGQTVRKKYALKLVPVIHRCPPN